MGFLTAGFPSRRQFHENLAAVAAACDVVEIGVPFSDPMADGSTIQRASFVALADGVTLPWILQEVAALPQPRTTPILLMSYLNPLLAYGLEALPRAARQAGVAGFIVPDLPYRGKRRSETRARPRGPGAGADGDAGYARAASRDALQGGAGFRLCGDDDRHHRERPWDDRPRCPTMCSPTWIA